MNEKRVEQLESFLKDSPNDPFLKYALALEYVKANEELALKYFKDLLLNHPDYLPAYYHAADLFVEMEMTDEAISTFEKGIELAKALKEQKALAELQNSYQNFLFELD